MKIYTKKGDQGYTSLVGGTRVLKNNPLLYVYGTLDELNSFIGVLIAHQNYPFLTQIQQDLFKIGGLIATEPQNRERYWKNLDPQTMTQQVEQEIDQISAQLEPLRSFILPQGSHSIAYAHVCRTICRRAERELVHLAQEDQQLQLCSGYLNRLSDFFYILSRYFHKIENINPTNCVLGD